VIDKKEKRCSLAYSSASSIGHTAESPALAPCQNRITVILSAIALPQKQKSKEPHLKGNLTKQYTDIKFLI
jgi:hypothetical protein